MVVSEVAVKEEVVVGLPGGESPRQGGDRPVD